MIIAIPLDESKENVCASFGRAPYFLFHDADTNTAETIINTAAQAQGGAGIKAAQLVADRHAGAVVTVRCGQNAAEVLLASNMIVYKAAGTSVTENLAAFSEGKLEKLERFHPGFHGNA